MKRKGSFLRGTIYSAALLSALAAAGCSNETKQQLGLAKTAPDEFAVVTRAPLSVPPDYTLRPPRPGSARPMEDNTVEQARKTLFGVDDVDGTKASASTSFMDRIGVDEAESGIREKLEVENETYVEENRPVAEKLLFWDRKNPTVEGDVLDPKEEYEKLSKENGQSGANPSGASDE